MSESWTMIPFGDLLRRYRLDRGMSETQLAAVLNRDPSTIERWERGGGQAPFDAEMSSIVEALDLEREEAFRLSKALDRLKREPSVDGLATSGRTKDDAARDLQVQIRDLRSLVESVSSRLDAADSSMDDVGSIREEVRGIKDVVSEIQTTGRELTAPVSVPPRGQLEVRLVPLNAFNSLEEHRADESKWYSWTAMLAGAIIGIIVNLATGGEASSGTWVILATFLVVGAFSFWQARIFTARANAVKQRLLHPESQVGIAPDMPNRSGQDPT